MKNNKNSALNLKPVTIIGGFLGAGKTTYINEQIQKGKLNPTSLILVNDFGSINVDYSLLEGNQQNVVQLSNGCICCSLRGSLADQLYSLESETWFENITEVYIETSGVSLPKPILDTLTLSKSLTVKEWVTIIDMSQALRWYKDVNVTDIWQQQIRMADRLILNRCADERAKALVETLRKKSVNLQYVPSVNTSAQKHPSLIQSTSASHSSIMSRVIPMQHNQMVTATMSQLQLSEKKVFEQYCRKYTSVLLRAKGMITVRGQRYLVQVSGNGITWHSPPKTLTDKLVVIGRKAVEFQHLIDAIKSQSYLMEGA